MTEKYEAAIKNIAKVKITDAQMKIIKFAYKNGVGFISLYKAAQKNDALSEIKNLTKGQLRGAFEKIKDNENKKNPQYP